MLTHRLVYSYISLISYTLTSSTVLKSTLITPTIIAIIVIAYNNFVDFQTFDSSCFITNQHYKRIIIALLSL